MNLSSFLRFFPQPDFLNPLCAGISVSDTCIRVFEFEHAHNKLGIRHFSEHPLPEGAVIEGEIHNKDQVVAVLKEIKKLISTSRIRASLPEEKTYLFKTNIPIMASKFMRGAIEPRLEENVPLSANHILFDFNVVNQVAKQKDHIEVVVSVIPTVVADVYMEVFTEAELIPYRLEIESQAIARAVFAKHDRGTHMIVHCAPKKIGIYIVSEGIIQFTSTTAVLDLNSDVASIAKEIQKIVSFWSSLLTSADRALYAVDRIEITGEGFNEQFVTILSDATQYNIHLANVWMNVFDLQAKVPELSFGDSIKYAPTIGLALQTHILI